MTWHPPFILLDRFVATLGVVGTLVFIFLIFLMLCVLVGLLYMVLTFEESPFRHLFGFIRQYLTMLSIEFKSGHPAIRIELVMHCFFGFILLLSLVLLSFHSLIPWATKLTEYIIATVLVADFFLLLYLTRISVKLSLRVPYRPL